MPRQRRAPLLRALPVTLLLGLGCSLITDLDVVGGPTDVGGSGGGGQGSGGEGAGGEIPSTTGGVGGVIGAGGAGGAGGAPAATGGGGNPEGGFGAAGDGGSGASAGAPVTGGTSAGGAAGESGSGALAGAGAGGGCSGADCCVEGTTYCDGECVDLQTDARHCGMCGNACAQGVVCDTGICIDAPCTGLCANPRTFVLNQDGWRADNIGTAAACFASPPEYTAENGKLICWQFEERTLRVNGQPLPCKAEPGEPLAMPRRGGGYCVQVSSGSPDFAGFKLTPP